MKLKKFARSFSFASKGIATAFRSQFNMRFHFFAALIVLITAFALKISSLELCILLFCISSVIGAELINTSIEINVDLAMPERNDRAGQAKDIAAAAVLVVSFVSAIIGCIIFLPKIFA